MNAAQPLRKWADVGGFCSAEPCRIASVDPDELASARFIERWDALARHASDPNPHYESWFLNPSLAEFADTSSVEVLAFTQSDELIAVLPVARQLDYYGKPLPHLANWMHPNIFLGSPLVKAGCERLFWDGLLDWADDRAGTSMLFHLSEFALETSLHEALDETMTSHGREYGLVGRYDRAVLQANLPSDEYRARNHSKKKRKDMRRRLKKLGEQGEVEFHWHDDPAGIDAWIDQFLFIESSGWKGKAGSALACSSDTANLFRASVTGAAERGRARRISLTLDGQPIAMLVNFQCGEAAFGFKTAFDETFSAYSPGVLLEDEYLSELDREGFTWSDSCAAPDHSVMNSMWAERRPIGKISIPIGGPVRRALAERFIRFESNRFARGANQ